MSGDRKSGETLEQFAIRKAWEYGHFWNPSLPNVQNVKQADLTSLRATDAVVVEAFRSFALSDVSRYAKHVFNIHGRAPVFDGQFGPAVQAMMEDAGGRCPVPDYAPPKGVVFSFDDPDLQHVVEQMQARGVQAALGNGNWQNCHNVNDAHCATVQVDPSGLPSFLSPVFKTVLTRVQKAYADIGLLFRFLDGQKKDILTGEEFNSNINIDMSFSSSSSGWIGLAIVGTGETCGGRIWAKFLNTYKGGTTQESVITQWTSLIKHELCHNCGFSHSSGGVMNPSIVNNLPPEWSDSDPTTPKLKRAFSGVPVAVPGGGPTPIPPVDPPTDSIQAQINALRQENLIQGVQIQYLLNRINKK